MEDILFILITLGIFLGAIVIISSKIKKDINRVLFQGALSVYKKKTLFLLVLNFPLYLLMDVFQASARKHIEPASGDIMAYFLILLFTYLLLIGLRNRAKIIEKWYVIIFYFILLIMPVFWATMYWGISCDICY